MERDINSALYIPTKLQSNDNNMRLSVYIINLNMMNFRFLMNVNIWSQLLETIKPQLGSIIRLLGYIIDGIDGFEIGIVNNTTKFLAGC